MRPSRCPPSRLSLPRTTPQRAPETAFACTPGIQPSALDSITRRKRLRIIRAAMSYMKWKRLEGQALRFDFVLIEAGRIEWIPDAFESSSYYTY